MNTTTWKNRALSVLLTVIMVFSMLPLPAFAANTGDTAGDTAEETVEPPEGGSHDTDYTVEEDGAAGSRLFRSANAAGDAVADVDGTAYTNLIEAFDTAQGKESATVKLLADVSTSGNDGNSEYCVSSGGYNFKSGKVTLDLNGKTLTWTAGSDRAPCVYDAALTVQDSQGGGKLYSGNGEALQITGGTLNIQSGTIESGSKNALKIQGGNVCITGGTIKSNHYFGNGVNVSPDTVNNRTATLTVSGDAQLIGGSYDSGKNNSASGLCVTRKSDENPTVRLSGGTYTGGKGITCYNTTVSTLLEENCLYMLDGSAVTETNVDTLASGVTVAPDPNAPVAYINANGDPATRSDCTEITAATAELTGGWYVVKENVTINGDLKINNEDSGAHLILCDGATLTVTGSVRLETGRALNIYGQTEHTGTLKVGSDTLEDPAVEAFAQHGGTINFYGGTVTMQAKAGVQTVANKVYDNRSAGMKTVWTDSPNVWCAISNSDGRSVTVTRCKDHLYVYYNNGERGHTSRCDLCMTEDNFPTPHSYTGWTDNGDGTHTGTCACGAESTEDHTLTYTPNAGGLTHSVKCSECGYAATAENHDFSVTGQWGKQCACGAYLAASYNNRNYATLASAVEAAKDGGAVKLENDVGENITIADGMNVTIDLNNKTWTHTNENGNQPALTVNDGSVTVQNGTLTSGSSSNAATTVEVEGGELTVGENMTIQGGNKSEDAQCPAIEVKGGELVLNVGTKLGFGMKVAEDKLLKDYLPADTAFTVNGTAINGYVTEYSSRETLVVAAHTTHTYTDGVCDCGYECEHEKFSNGVCETCGYVCAHPSDRVKNENNVYTCGVCGAELVVKVETADGKTTYYAEKHNAYNDETLWLLFNNALESGSTVTLLADNLYAWAYVSGGKQITLDLNGKTLTETSQGITVGQGSREDTSTDNKLFVKGALGASEAAEAGSYAFRTWEGGELDLEDFESGGKIGGIIADGGKVTTGVSTNDIKIGTLYINNGGTELSFSTGKFGTISIGITKEFSRTAGSLLGQGYAFQNADGSYVPYDTEISQASSLENVTVVECDHKLPDDFSGTTCPYCNTALAATVTVKNGQITGYTEFTAALNAANAASGCTLTLLADVNGNLTVKANVTIHLSPNGHTVNGTVIVQKNANLTATGGTFSGKVNCVGTLDLTGSNLTGDLSVNGNAALNSCYVGKAVAVNKGGTLTVTGGSLSGVAVNNGGKLEFQNGNVSGTVTAKSGGSVVVTGGHIDTLVGEDNATLTLSGGDFTKITVSGNNLMDCLANGCAFQDSNGIVDGRTGILSHVEVIEHPTHSHAWDTASHELVCACGNVAETDTDDPLLYDSGNKQLEDGGSYYGDLIFTADEKNLATVTVDGNAVAAENGKYKIIADNKAHTITATDNAGNTTTVTVTVYKVYNVTLVGGEGYTIDGESTIGYNQGYTFTVNIAEGYSRVKGSYKVLVNGAEVPASSSDENSDQFAVIAIGDLAITVEGVADITAPEAEMTIANNNFKSFLNTITFGLFFKNTQTVTVTADDAGSGVAKAEYLLSETAFAAGEDVTGNWTEFNLNNGTGSFSIAPNAKGSVYVRVTDNAGNYTVINSDGVVLYTDSEAGTTSIEFTRLSPTDVTITVDLKGNTVKSVFCDGNELNGTSYNVLYPSAESNSTLGTIVLKNMFLSTLAAGKHTITVEYNPMGETYKGAEGNEAPATTEVMLTVVKADRTLDFSAPNAIYDGEAYDDLSITDQPTGTTISYKEQDADDSTYGTAAPKNAGSYTVKITVAEDENYNAKTFTKDFTISPKEVTIKDVVVKAVKEYDGSAAAEGMNITAAYIDGKCTDDDLTIDITGAEANFSDKNVGVGKTVTFSGFKLGGSAAGNYKLTAQPASVTADITAKALTIANLKVKDKLYDGTNKAEIDGTPALNGVVDGDTLTLVNGTPVFGSTAVGEDIAITFTAPFALAGDEVTLKNYTLTQPTGITADINEWAATGDEFTTTQDWSYYDFTVTAKDGYQLSLTNTADGSWMGALTAPKQPTGVYDFTFYVKDTATGAISTAVTRAYKIDKAPPTGTVTLIFGGQSFTFNDFTNPNKITFDTFSNGDVTVTVAGTDVGSGVKSVSYYKSDKVLTDMQVLRITDWTEIDGDHFTIEAEDMTQFVLYVRIVDRAGNERYLNTNGVVFDTTAPEIIGVENGKTYYVTQRVFADDVNPASVTLNGVAQDVDSFFELAGDTNAIYTIVATDEAGNVTTYTVTMKPISAITDAIKDITADNVTSDDADTIDEVTQQILDIAAESDEDVIGAEQWNKLLTAAENCKKLEQRIAEISAEISRLTDAVNDYDIDKVTSANKADIEQLITDINVLLATDNLTAAERAALEALRATAQALLDHIAAAKSAAEADEITAVKDITKDNVALSDKDDLQKAEKVLEKALDDFDGNYTDDERKALNDKLDTVKATLDAIGNAKKAAEEIEKLPSVDEVKLTDKNEVERVGKIVDALTENEKTMLGEKAIGKLKALNDKLAALADNAKKPTSPTTGDTSNLALWIALPFISGGAVTGVTVAGKKKKQQDRNV